MSNLLIQKIDKKQLREDLPEIKPGYTVRVHQKIKEGEKERVQVYEGLVIAISHGHGPSKTITVRKIVEGIGVEKIFSIHSPSIVKIEAIRIGKVRRAKLYYMRNVSGKAARLKEVLVSGKVAAEKREAALAAQEAAAAEENTAPETEEVVETASEATTPETTTAEVQSTIEDAPVESDEKEETPAEGADSEEAPKDKVNEEK